jgi:RND family efflux transporter MFP subunit
MIMSTEPLQPEPPADGPMQTPPAPPPIPPARRIAGCLRRSRRLVAAPFRRLDWRVLASVLLAVVFLPVWHEITVHAKPKATAAPTTLAPAVAVGRVTRQDLYSEVPFTAEFRPYVEVELHAKVSGFVREMKVDFGDRVKAGQLLATLEVPELQDELQNAIATEQQAEADYTNADLIYKRLEAVDKQHPNLVAEQELDTAEARDRTAAAAIAAKSADVAKYRTLVGYTRITAPFDGVITKRYADPGTLIQAGTASATQSLPLVRVSDNYHLRLDFPVSLPYVKDTHVGDSVEVRVTSLGGKSFTGIITRTADRVEDETRTMIAEVEVPNPDLKLVPGMYATVVFKPERRAQALAVPTEAVRGNQQHTVYVVNARQEIEERPVTLGLETPTCFEVLGGLKEGDLVVVGELSQVTPGQKVVPKLPKLNSSLAQE